MIVTYHLYKKKEERKAPPIYIVNPACQLMPVMIMHIPISIIIRNAHCFCSIITAIDAVHNINAEHMIRAGSPISAVIILITNTAEMLINTVNINALAFDFLISII
jgi:hypothetical protein